MGAVTPFWQSRNARNYQCTAHSRIKRHDQSRRTIHCQACVGRNCLLVHIDGVFPVVINSSILTPPDRLMSA
ncbi:hypothetical protein Naga_101216g2 [Nannochloropsis gaditana]|uniref:Uncharacterized protein n=1 Tax=Nannochloropsis gaditana TaxID=72520 RepID=W7T0C7_9STRA|nr:hypothetical protein Naga_101216g2 [Nannochloropsis gaditana]